MRNTEESDEEVHKQVKQEHRGYPVLRRIRTRKLDGHEGGNRHRDVPSNRKEAGIRPSSKGRDQTEGSKQTQEEMSAAHQQAVLQSLASYLEGELMVRLKAFAELLSEVDSISNERLFYRDKLCQIEKICEKAQPAGSQAPLINSVVAILRDTADQPRPGPYSSN